MPSTTKTSRQATADVFTAIAHPVRRRILDQLVQGDLTVTHLAEPLEGEMTRSAVSQHLAILLQSGLVEMQRRGRENYYHLRPENLNEVARWIGQYEQFWTEKLDALEAYLDGTEDETP